MPRLDGKRLFGKGKMSKCVLCTQLGLNRLDAGYELACVKTCLTDALLYDDRDKLVTIAKDKVILCLLSASVGLILSIILLLLKHKPEFS